MSSLRERFSKFVPSRTTLLNLLLGQLLSVLISGTGISSSLLAANGVNLSSSQSFLNYFLIAAAFLGPWLFRVRWTGFKVVMKDRWLMYMCLAVCDVEANFLVVLAYQYTSLSSVMLLDCFSIPCVIVLSWFLLKRRVTWWQVCAIFFDLLFRFFLSLQLLGVGMCVGGVVTLVLTDFFGQSFRNGSAPNPLMGDFLCLAASVLYAVSNVGQEATVTQGSKLEYLALIGLFATPISLGQSAGIEHARWTSTIWTPVVIGCMVTFTVCLWCMYALVKVDCVDCYC
jgi:solute carrier family 35, member F1/2